MKNKNINGGEVVNLERWWRYILVHVNSADDTECFDNYFGYAIFFGAINYDTDNSTKLNLGGVL